MIFFAILSAVFFTAAAGAVGLFKGSMAVSRTDGLTETEYVKKYDTPALLKFKDLLQMKNKISDDCVSAYRETISPPISSKYGVFADEIKLVQVDENYNAFYRYKMLKGVFPDRSSIEEGDRLAVISDSLALKLFNTMDVIGSELAIQGSKFNISGVYESRDSVLWKLTGDGFDRVFVPYKCIYGGVQDQFDVLAVARYPKDSIVTFTSQFTSLGFDLSAYEPVDMSVLLTVLSQYNRLFIFIVGALAIICILIFLYNRTKKMIANLKDSSDSYYFMGIVRSERKRLAAYIPVSILCCLGIFLIVYMMTKFRFYVSDNYIPDDNIFDIRFYIGAILNDIRNASYYPDRICSMFEYAYKRFLIFDLVCLSASLLFLIPAFMFGRLAIRIKMNGMK